MPINVSFISINEIGVTYKTDTKNKTQEQKNNKKKKSAVLGVKTYY
jgi:hypothetical protein